MATINSVLGPIDTANLGFTLMHEHIIVAPAGVFGDYPELLGTNLMGRVVDGLKKAKEGGIDTIIDATTLDLGRNINLLAEASAESGVNIIACSGWWLDIPRYFVGVSIDQLTQVFTRECEQGISGTNIKAGILKAASDIAGVTPESEIILRAVARASLNTGVPIMLHSYSPGRVGERQLAVLKEEGIDLKRIKIDHSNDTTDVEYLIWLLEQGCYIGMDRYPGHNVSPIARTKTLKTLINSGFSTRLLLSHDQTILYVMTTNNHLMEERLRLNPHGYLYIKKVVFPQLQEMGVPEAIINTLCVDGPRNFFEGI